MIMTLKLQAFATALCRALKEELENYEETTDVWAIKRKVWHAAWLDTDSTFAAIRLLWDEACAMHPAANIAHILCTFQNHLLYDMDVCGVASDLLRRLGAIHTAFRRGGGLFMMLEWLCRGLPMNTHPVVAFHVTY